jgi:hypothetical protein
LEKARHVLLMYKHEYFELNVIIQNTAIANESTRQAKLSMMEQVRAFTEKEQVIGTMIGLLRQKLIEVKETRKSKAGYLNELDDMVYDEERIREGKEREVERLRMFHWAKKNEHAGIETESARTDSRSLRIRSTLSMLEAKEWTSMELVGST